MFLTISRTFVHQSRRGGLAHVSFSRKPSSSVPLVVNFLSVNGFLNFNPTISVLTEIDKQPQKVELSVTSTHHQELLVYFSREGMRLFFRKTHGLPSTRLHHRLVARLRMRSGSLPFTVFLGARAFPSLAQRRWKPLFEIGRRDWPARRHGERFA